MQEASMDIIETYIAHHQNTISQYIVTSMILDLCLAVEHHPGPKVTKRRWEQEGLDWGVS